MLYCSHPSCPTPHPGVPCCSSVAASSFQPRLCQCKRFHEPSWKLHQWRDGLVCRRRLVPEHRATHLKTVLLQHTEDVPRRYTQSLYEELRALAELRLAKAMQLYTSNVEPGPAALSAPLLAICTRMIAQGSYIERGSEGLQNTLVLVGTDGLKSQRCCLHIVTDSPGTAYNDLPEREDQVDQTACAPRRGSFVACSTALSR